jgi:hypothetical protein
MRNGLSLRSALVRLVACGAVSVLAAEPPRYDSILRVAIAGDPPSLDRHQEQTFKVTIPMSICYRPFGPFLYTVSCMHCMTVLLAQGGEGLGAMWGEEKTRQYLQKAGFGSIETHRLPHDIQNNWYVVRK